MINGAIFDFDGTLFDSMLVWENAGENYLRSLGAEPEPDLSMKLKDMSLQQSAVYIREKYRLDLSAEEIMTGINKTVEEFYFYHIQPKTGVKEFLDKLKKNNIKMCIATATESYQVEAALKRCNMEGFFDGIFTCTDIGRGKDKPDIFRRAMGHLQTDCANTVVFEDAAHALKTAKSDGFITVAVYDSHEENQNEMRRIADFYIEDYRNPVLMQILS